MSKDTCWTRAYKGHYIHGHYDRDRKQRVIEVQMMNEDGSFTLHQTKSLHSAKCLITRMVKEKK